MIKAIFDYAQREYGKACAEEDVNKYRRTLSTHFSNILNDSSLLPKESDWLGG